MSARDYAYYSTDDEITGGRHHSEDFTDSDSDSDQQVQLSPRGQDFTDSDSEQDHESEPELPPIYPLVYGEVNFTPDQTPFEKLMDVVEYGMVPDFVHPGNVRYTARILENIPDSAPAYAAIIRRGDVPSVFSDVVRSKVKSYDLPLEAAAEIGDLELATRFAPLVSGGLTLVGTVALGKSDQEIHENMLQHIKRLDILLYGVVRRGDLNSTVAILPSIDDYEVLRKAFVFACGSGHISITEILYEQIKDDDLEDLEASLYRGFNAALMAKHPEIAMFVFNIIDNLDIDMDYMDDQLEVAIANGLVDIAHALIPHTNTFENSLRHALARGYLELADQILKRAGEKKDQIGDEYIMKAVSMGAVNVGKLITKDNGCEMTQVAFISNNIPVLRLILNHDFDTLLHCILQYIGNTQDPKDSEHLMAIYDDIMEGNHSGHIRYMFAHFSIEYGLRELAAFFMKYNKNVEQFIPELVSQGWFDLVPGFPEFHYNDEADIDSLLVKLSCVYPKTPEEMEQLKIFARNVTGCLGMFYDEYHYF